MQSLGAYIREQVSHMVMHVPVLWLRCFLVKQSCLYETKSGSCQMLWKLPQDAIMLNRQSCCTHVQKISRAAASIADSLASSHYSNLVEL